MIYGLNKKMALVCALSLGAILVSCGPKNADKIGEAQLCLDDTTQGGAAACLEKISGIDTAAASLLRCSAGFIDEGFTQATRFKSAFDALGTSGANNTESFMGVLSFSSKSTSAANVTFANETYEHCVKSKAKGFMLLGSMAKTATILADLTAGFTIGTQPSQADITAGMTAAANDPAAKAAIGSAVATTYAASCQTGQQSNAALCTQLDSALTGVDTTDSTAVGNAVLTYWQNN